jgi:hypothetical protein
MTSRERQTLRHEASKALGELQSLRQSVGVAGYRLRRCKPGTKRHNELMASLKTLEFRANTHADTIQAVLLTFATENDP